MFKKLKLRVYFFELLKIIGFRNKKHKNLFDKFF